MMGERQTDQPALFYEFSLERHVSGDHLLRSIDRFVDLGDIREQLRPFYSDTGRPSVDPELMIRMLIVGYCMGIRSERRLCEEVHLNLAYRWFCRLGLDGAVPDHSTFSKNRHGRFRESDLLRKLFESTVARCIAKGLVGGEGFAVDASMIKADANRQNSTPGDRWEPPDDPGHAVREYLAVLDEAALTPESGLSKLSYSALMPIPLQLPWSGSVLANSRARAGGSRTGDAHADRPNAASSRANFLPFASTSHRQEKDPPHDKVRASCSNCPRQLRGEK